jgi:phage shock protein E
MREIEILLLLGLAACGADGTREAGDGAIGSSGATESPRIEASEIEELLRDGDLLFLDVREPEEISELGTIEGYVNIPVDQVADRLDELPRDKPILTA